MFYDVVKIWVAFSGWGGRLVPLPPTPLPHERSKICFESVASELDFVRPYPTPWDVFNAMECIG